MKNQTFTLHSPLDMHLHLRDGEMCQMAAHVAGTQFAGAVVMPNLVPAIDTLDAMDAYCAKIESAAGTDFRPLMTLFLGSQTPRDIEAAKANPRFFAMKLYPAGVTTNSENGISDFSALVPALEAMQDLGVPLLVHGESNGFVLEREAEFLPVYRRLAAAFPRLKIVMEHISDARTLGLLDEFENLYATVTLHHLLFTLDDLAGGKLNPHLFCKPIVKLPRDREAIRAAVFGGNAKIMFGSDSAPHPKTNKESAGALGGSFTGPILLPALAELFAKHYALDKLQAFVSDNARKIYGLNIPEKTITLVNEPMNVPATVDLPNGEQVVPVFAGTQIGWKLA